MGKTPIITHSKRQTMVESSTYGAEFNAARTATEDSIEIRYMLRSLGVMVDKPTKLYGNNKAVYYSIAAKEGLCKKRHTSIAFHKLREAAAARIIRPYHVSSGENTSNFLTKALGYDKHNKATNHLLK